MGRAWGGRHAVDMPQMDAVAPAYQERAWDQSPCGQAQARGAVLKVSRVGQSGSLCRGPIPPGPGDQVLHVSPW